MAVAPWSRLPTPYTRWIRWPQAVAALIPPRTKPSTPREKDLITARHCSRSHHPPPVFLLGGPLLRPPTLTISWALRRFLFVSALVARPSIASISPPRPRHLSFSTISLAIWHTLIKLPSLSPDVDIGLSRLRQCNSSTLDAIRIVIVPWNHHIVPDSR